MSSQGDDEIGYGKPPVHSRFVKGRSGNPKGRPKGSRNFKTELLAEFEEKIPIREGNRVGRVSKGRALIKTMMAKGLKGDARAAEVLVKWLRDREDPASDVDEALSVDDQALLTGIEARLIARNPPVSKKSGADE
jgi:hypothetical protein